MVLCDTFQPLHNALPKYNFSYCKERERERARNGCIGCTLTCYTYLITCIRTCILTGFIYVCQILPFISILSVSIPCMDHQVQFMKCVLSQ